MSEPIVAAEEVKAAFTTLARDFTEFRSANDERLAEIERKGAADPLTEDKVDRLNAQVSMLGDQIARFDTMLRRPAAGGERPGAVDGTRIERRRAFLDFVRKGVDQALPALERKALSVGSDPDGGYLVPSDMTGRIVTRIRDSSPVRAVASVQTISTDALEGIRDIDEAGAGWVAETGARTETVTPSLGKWRVPVHEMYAEPRATQQLLDDSAVDAEGWLEAKLAERFARLEAAAFVTGDGAGKPRGFLSYATAAQADGARAWGVIEHVGTGASGAFAASDPADVLVDAVYRMKAGYRAGAVWMMPRTVVQAIRKMKAAASDEYLWQPSLQLGQPATLLSFPVIEAEDMPAPDASSLSIAFANFRTAYQIVDRQGIRVLRDPFTAKPYVKLYTTRRVGGDVVQFEAIKLIRFG